MKKFKLTKLQRHTAYILMLIEAEREQQPSGFCYFISMFFRINVYTHHRFKKYFPELFAKKPPYKTENDHWFKNDYEGWRTRITLLKECINQTY